MNPTTRNPTRSVQIGRTTIGGNHPIAVQSMAATRTQDTEATIRQLRLLAEAGADVIRVAVDSKKDVEALAQIAPTVDVPLSVDLQENYRLVRSVAPHVEKIRYNPGHLYHHEKRQAGRRQGRLYCRRGRQARLRPARGSQLRLGRSGPSRALSG